jgi:tetratricopeptide (TPR) repeat protein
VRNNGGFEEVVDSMLDPTDDAGCEAILIRARARGEVMRIAVILAATFGLGSIAAGPALADGGSDRSNTTTCSKGEVWDSRSQKCVKAENGVLPDKTLTDYAFALVKAGRYGEALDVLDLLKNPNTPVALNYRGYATRKLGRIDDGIGYYLKSVALDPHYAQVREYLGEAYLLKGDMARAAAQLQAIKQICGSTCEEYEHLAVAIADPADL